MTKNPLWSFTPLVRWDANRFTRALCLIGAPLCMLVFAFSALALHAAGPGNPSTGYVVSSGSENGCTAHLAETPGGPATVVVQLKRSSRGICGKVSPGQRILFDPATHQEMQGRTNYIAGVILFGLLTAGMLVLTVMIYVAWVRRLRRLRTQPA